MLKFTSKTCKNITFLIIFFLLTIFSHSTTAQGWVTVSPSNYARLESSSVEVNDKMYIFSGFYNYWNLTRVTEVYDPAIDKWTILSQMPIYRTHQGFAVDGDNVWLAGGWADQYKVHEKTVLIYNIPSNSWSYGPPLPVGTSSFAMVRLGRKLHAIGGLQGGMENDTGVHYVLNLDKPNDGWSNAAPLPVPRNHHSAAVVGGKIYVIGGQQGHDGPVKYLKDLHVYDPSEDSWSQLADLPTARSHFEPGTTVFDGKILIAGGRNVSDINNITEYNPESNQWKELSPLPLPILAPNVKVIKDKLIAANGATSEPLKTTRVRPIARAGADKLLFWPQELTLSTEDEQAVSSTIWLSTFNNKVNYNLTLSSSASWLNIENTSGQTDASGTEIIISINTETLAPGEYYVEIVASAPGYPNVTFPVSVTIAGEPTENLPPVVNAGQDQVIKLPVNFITLTGTASDPDGDELSYMWTKISGPSATMEGINTLSLALSDLVAGNYTFRLTVTDDKDASSFDEVNLTVVPADNKPPSVSITSPGNNSVFQSDDSIVIEADAADEDGIISMVEFFVNNNVIGERNSAPYQLTWNNPEPGSYEIKAKATDNSGTAVFSSAINIVVREPDSPPVILITSPAPGSEFFEMESIVIEVEAVDEENVVSKIEFFLNNDKIGEDTSSPYSFIWENAVEGTYQLLAQATTSGGDVILSEPVVISVLPALPTSIKDDLNLRLNLQVYPVPSSGNFFVEFQSETREDFFLDLYNLQGKFIKRLSSGTAKSGQVQKLEVYGNILPKGTYLIMLKLGDAILSKKLILAK